jgi:preprotein translocase subunit SecF
MKLNVIKQRSLWWTFSVSIILAGIISMVISTATLGTPLRLGLDFVGGTRLQYELDCSKPGNCDKPIDITAVRQVMDAQGLGNSSIQVLGDKQQALTIRTKNLNVEERTQLQNTLSEKIGAFDPKTAQNDTVGPTLGRQLFSSGLLAIILSFAVSSST